MQSFSPPPHTSKSSRDENISIRRSYINDAVRQWQHNRTIEHSSISHIHTHTHTQIQSKIWIESVRTTVLFIHKKITLGASKKSHTPKHMKFIFFRENWKGKRANYTKNKLCNNNNCICVYVGNIYIKGYNIHIYKIQGKFSNPYTSENHCYG